MDNVTHSLIGFALGSAIARKSPRRDAIIATAMIGSNLPDLDFVVPTLLSGAMGSRRLAYLLHHRGHSHTVMLALALAAFAAWAGAKITRTPLRGTFAALYFTGLLGVLLHIGADFWNNYGVHPFFPFVNRWFYGDMIYIVEPLILFCLLPLAFDECRKLWAKATWAVVALALLVAVWALPAVPAPLSAALTAWFVLFCALQRLRGGVLTASLGFALVLASFATGRSEARDRIIVAHSSGAPGEKVLQLVTFPSPGNPFCWRSIVVSREGGAYFIRNAALSLWPALVSVDTCAAGELDSPRTMPVVPPTLKNESALHWGAEFHGQFAELRRLAEENCHFAALLRYIRAPFWTGDAAERPVVGDARYDRDPGLGFAELDLGSVNPNDCPRFVPPWDPPIAWRED